jgi:glycosyltransferase involved in cell wall biosynthesis
MKTQQSSVVPVEKSNRIKYFRKLDFRALARNIVKWIEARVYHPDYYMTWISSAVREAERNFPHGNGIHALWATGNPWSDFEVGYRLSRRWGLPLILDFRDGWTITHNEFESRRPTWARQWDRRRLNHYLMIAQSVVFLSKKYAQSYQDSYRNLSPDKIHVIPNGFEPEPVEPLPIRGKQLRVFYAGLLALRKYDTLFEAFSNLLRRGDALDMEIVFVGTEEPHAEQLAMQLCLQDHIHFLPHQPFAVVQQMMKEAHALLILGEQPMPGMEFFVASKVFHYLALARPVLGILPNNETKNILHALDSQLLADVNSVQQVEQVLLKLYNAWQSDQLSNLVLFRDALNKYSEPYLSKMLSDILDGKSKIRVEDC